MSGQTQSGAAASVTIHYTFPTLNVAVTHPSSLQSVLKELCEHTQAQCSGLEQTSSYNVAPTSYHGTWSAVVNQLMEGTALNYAAGPPSVYQGGQLIVQGQRASLPPPSNVPVQPNYNEPAMQAAPANVADASPGTSGGDTQPNEHSGSPGGSMAAGIGGSGFVMGGGAAASSSPPPGMQLGPLGGYMPINAPTDPPAYMPFLDRNGNLIPVSNTPPQYLPFPDSHGNLIPVNPNDPGGSPFPATAIHHQN